jgi:hypothetical protein
VRPMQPVPEPTLEERVKNLTFLQHLMLSDPFGAKHITDEAAAAVMRTTGCTMADVRASAAHLDGSTRLGQIARLMEHAITEIRKRHESAP